jgi:long-chain acyl-CoA synthetase
MDQVIQKRWNDVAFVDYGEKKQYTHGEVAQQVRRFHKLFRTLGIQPGDKVAIASRNCSNWVVSYMAIMSYKAVAVTLLQDFKAEDLARLIEHSDSKMLIVGPYVWRDLQHQQLPELQAIISMDDFSFIHLAQPLQGNVEHIMAEDSTLTENTFFSLVQDGEIDLDSLALINYTSGSTGNSKGVMIPNRALWSNVLFADAALALEQGSRILSLLPLAHMYGFSFEFLYEFCIGCHVHFLTKAPSPKILLGAIAAVRPSLLVAVPLIIEKIVRGRVFPLLQTPRMKFMLSIPGLRNIVHSKIRQQILKAFGGNIYEVVVGGAPLNKEVGDFLARINFPITVGYGMTECAPIICYEDWKYFAKGSCGKQVPRMEVKIDSPDPHNVAGEIICKGMNVMLGYYKNPEATAEAIDADGWLHTGDLGTIDRQGNVFIRGRKKNMLLGANGQNIYPEEIEDKVLSYTPFDECVVVQRGEKLVCLAYITDAAVEAKGISREEVAKNIDQIRNDVNAVLPKYANISEFEIRNEEFIKTPKKNIKRYLYS